ncbi:MAG: DASS family sodium-coupled anion symporter [Bacteriovoracaceae bacterium]|nr:DASS family sodium-coupled anion symporter [Bacteriovoracaceae bacterium]
MIHKIRLNLFELLPLALAPLFAILIWLSPLEMKAETQVCAGIIVWVAGWWLSPLIPLHVTGLIGVLMAHFAGLSDWKALLTSYADPVIFLFMGGFILAKSLEHHKLDQWLVQKTMTIERFKGNTQILFLCLVVLTMLMSSMLSNTATTALVTPIGLEILRRSPDKKHSILLLLLAAAASIGGTMTPVGSPPNMIALGLMEKITGSRPDFLTWFLHMAPASIFIMLSVLWLYRKELKTLPKTGANFEKPKPLENEQKYVFLIFIMTALMWILPGLLPLMGFEHLSLSAQKLLPESAVAIISAVALLIWPTKKGALLPWEVAQKIDWGTLLLFGSGIALGTLAFHTGLADLMAQKLLSISHLPTWALLIVAIIGTLMFTEIASNTATANLVVPVLLAIPAFLVHADVTIYAVVAAANMAFMLPVGTPPNAIVYGTGLIPLSVMAKRGLMANLGAAIVIILFFVIIF